MLRGIYHDLVPALAEPLQSITRAMLEPRLQPLQHLLSVSGTIASIVVGADAGALIYGLHVPLAIAIPAGAALGVILVAAALRSQVVRWRPSGPLPEPHAVTAEWAALSGLTN